MRVTGGVTYRLGSHRGKLYCADLQQRSRSGDGRQLSRVHRAGCPLRRRRRRKDTLGALDGLAGVGEGCVVRSVPSRRGLAVARAAPSVPAILWLAAHPRRRLQAARFATRAATRTAKGSRWCAEVGRHTAGRAARRRPGYEGPRGPRTIRGSSHERRAIAKAEQLLVDLG